MKKTLLLMALAALVTQAQAYVTLTANYAIDPTTYTFDASEDFSQTFADGTEVEYTANNGYLSGYDAANGLTLTLNLNTGSDVWTSGTKLIYTSASESNGTIAATGNTIGFMIDGADGNVYGMWGTGKWNNAKNTEIAKSELTDTVTVTLSKDAGTKMTDAVGTVLYNAGDLKSSGTVTTSTYINSSLITEFALIDKGVVDSYTYTNSADSWSKTFAAAETAVLGGLAKHEVKTSSTAVLGKGNIVVDGNTQLFLQTYNNGGDLIVNDNIYIGGTTYQETNYSGVAIRFGNNGTYTSDSSTVDAKTTLNGNLYLLESANIQSSGSNAIEIAGDVTDVVDGKNTGSTLTVTGDGYTFSGAVTLTGLTLNSSVAFTGDVNVGALSLADGVSITSTNAITTSALISAGQATVDCDLSLVGTAETPKVLTLGGTLNLDGNDLTLGYVELGGALLESLLNGSAESVTLFSNVGTFNGEDAFDEAIPGYIVFTNTAMQPGVGAYELAYADGNVTLTLVPEPATATLSLLALAGLAARRRRR